VRRFVTAIALALSCVALGSAQTNGPGDAGIYSSTLSNGLRVIVVEDHAAPVVQTAMWYHFGSLDETPGKTGLAHALEHMMFRGTSNVSAGGLDDITARLGAQMNGETTYDYTQFYFIMPSDKLDVALYLEADRMAHAALRQADWSIERGAVLNELQGDEGSPFFTLLSRVRAAAYPGQPAGRTPTGDIADVERATAADIAKYYREWYAPNNAALVVAGDVDHRAVFAKAEHYFGSIKRRTLPARVASHPTPVSHTVSVESNLPFPFEILDLAYAVPGDTEAGEPEISTLTALIDNQLSPFYQALVQSNIALAIDAQEDTQLKGGLFNVFIVVSPGHTADEAHSVFQATMDNVLAGGFSPDLVDAAKSLTIADRLYNADSVDGAGDLAGYTYGIVGEKIADEDSRLAAITPASLLTITKTYLRRPTVVGRLSTSASGPQGGSDKSSAAITDDFSKRTPNGPIVVPSAIRAAVQAPTSARSTLAPVAFTLPNGIHVIVQEKHDRSTFMLSGDIASSAAFIPAGKEGLARLAGSLADYGSANYPFAARRRAIDMMGASVENGEGFSARGRASDFGEIVKILADGEMHPSFSEPWLSLQRDQLAGSLRQENSISGVQIDRAYQALLSTPDDPALRRPDSDSVNGLTRDDLLHYVSTYWRPDLTTIAVAGDVTPDSVRAALTSAFGSWNVGGAAPDARAQAYASAHTGHEYIGTDSGQVYIRLGQPALARGSNDYDTFMVLNQILGASGAFESRLWQELRQKRGLVYSVGSTVEAGPDRGDFRIEINASPQRVTEAVAFVRDELRRLQNEPVTPTELAEAKLRLVSDALLEEAGIDGQVSQLLDIERNHLPIDYYRTLNDRYAGITAADVQRVARMYLAPDHLIEIFAGPSGPWASSQL